MQIIVDGLAVSYNRSGHGSKNIVLLHGWADSAKTFESLVKQLEDDYSVTTLDLPGFGVSQAPASPWTLDDYAKVVADFLNKLKLDPTAIIGHSNGGAIAIYGLSHQYFESKKLILLASSGIREGNKLRKQALKAFAKPAKLAIKIAPKATQKSIKQKLYGAIGSDYMVAEHMGETFKNIVSADVLDDARSLRLPTLLIYGEEDQSTPVDHGKLLESAIPSSRLEIIETAGHFVHQEQVYKVARLIKEFIK
jgi:pimeloyl-ACP methyl ester carboxylesterase